MQQIAIMYAAYALLLLVGGVIGFSKAKSQASLISGIVTGVVYLLLGLLSTHIQYQGAALTVGAMLAIGLSVFFVMRYTKTRKPMPAMPMSILSALVGIGSIVLYILKR